MKTFVRAGSIVCVLMIWAWSVVGLAQTVSTTPLTLETALHQALENSNVVKLAHVRLEEAGLVYEEAKANQLAKPSTVVFLQAENIWTAAQRSWELARVDLEIQVEQAYYDVLRANMALGLAERSLNQAEAQLGSTQARYNVGMLSDVDLLAAETQVASAKAELNRARASETSANMRLNRLLGRDLEAVVELVDEFVYQPVAVDIEEALAQAISARLDLQQARNTLELRRKELAIADSPYSPALTKQKAQVSVEKAELEYAEKELDVILEIRQSYNALQEAERRIPLQERNVGRAKESLRISQVRFDAGVITSVELIEAQKALFQAETQFIQAVFDYNTQLARFYRSTGMENLET